MTKTTERMKELERKIEWEKEKEEKLAEAKEERERIRELEHERSRIRGDLYRKRLEISLKKLTLRKWLSMGGSAATFEHQWDDMYREAIRRATSNRTEQEQDKTHVNL